MQAPVRSRHETLNLKAYILEHGTEFHMCAVITQLSIPNEEPLFEVEFRL